jgi:DnaJ-class molecular chaperone
MSEEKGEMKRTIKVPGIVTCRYCDGTGKHQNEKCIVCDGKGEVEVVDKTRKCQWCKGRGYMMPGIPCTTCGGTGATRPINKQRLF